MRALEGLQEGRTFPYPCLETRAQELGMIFDL